MLGECLTDPKPADYDPYAALAAAIVKQAANDYVNDIRKLRNKKLTNRQWEMVFDDKFLCERFFQIKVFRSDFRRKRGRIDSRMPTQGAPIASRPV